MKTIFKRNRIRLSSEDIQSKQDFLSLLNRYKQWQLKRRTIRFSAGGIIILGLLALFLINKKEKAVVKSDYTTHPTITKSALIRPLKGLDVPFSDFKIKADEKSILYCNSGSKIEIPENAFIDSAGNLVKGDITFKYREFRDASDIIVSGIPMEYDTLNRKEWFESAGMVQLEAYKGNSKLKLKKGSKITVDYVSKYADNNYNQYMLDTTTGKWTCIGKDKTKAYEQPKMIIKNNVVVEELPEQIANTEPIKPKEASNKQTFRIEVDSTEFPEMFSFNTMLFEVDETYRKYDHRDDKVIWDDASIKKSHVKGMYQVKFTKGARKTEYRAYPVFKGEDYPKALKQYNKLFSIYSKKMADIEKNREQERKRIDRIKREEYLDKQTEANMTAAKYSAQIDNIYNLTYRAFQVETLGICNIDKVIIDREQITNNIKIDFPENITPNVVYYLMKGRNMVINMYPQNGLYISSKVKSADQMILGITADNKLFEITDEMIDSATCQGEVKHIKPIILKQEIVSIDQVKDIINGTKLYKGCSGLKANIKPSIFERDIVVQVYEQNNYILNVKDSKGKIIHSSTFSDKVFDYDLRFLKAGNYTLQVFSVGDNKTAKFEVTKLSSI